MTELIESSGLHIVIEDTALGTRPFWHDVEETEDPLYGLARHYLEEVKCPRTMMEKASSFEKDLDNRFGYLKDFVKHWNVNGVFANIIRNCDIHGFEVPGIKRFLEALGLPVLAIEQNYASGGLEALRTRFQAFKETIESQA
jgi:benzoyl-CoA reductase/2-hydroxyglutaryl-CoA dehydratase subunit BcrC/BadD/HgdB